MEEKFDSTMYGMNYKTGTKSISQKNTNWHCINSISNNDYNTLATSEIHDTCLLNYNLSVNKMLSVLIFLMFK